MRRLYLVGWLCAGCWFATLLGCGCGDSSPTSPVGSSEADSLPASPEDSMDSSPEMATPEITTPDSSGDETMDEMPAPTSESEYDDAMQSAGHESEDEGSEASDEMPDETMYDEQSTPEGEYETSPDENYMGESDDPQYDSTGMEDGRGPTKSTTYAELAQQAFRQGDDPLALRYLMAHAVTADSEDAQSLLDKMGYNARIQQPSFAVRWGVGIEFNRPPTYTGNIFPIGTAQQIGARPGRAGPDAGGEGGFGEGGGMGGMMGDGDFGGGRSVLPQPVKLLTGELGEKIIEQFTLRLERGDYGEVLKSPPAASRDAATAYGGNYDDSGFGGGHDGGARPGGQDPGPRSILPGVTLIDIGPTRDLVAKAKQAGVDVLCVFKIAVLLNPRLQRVINNTSLQIFDVATGKEVFSIKPLNNVEVQINRAEGKPDDVAKALIALFAHVDQTWRLGPLPPMTPEQVLTRIGNLLKEEPGPNPLPALAEVRMYHSRGLLQANHLELAYRRLLGDEHAARVLATGAEEEKKELVQKWFTATPNATGPRDILQGS